LRALIGRSDKERADLQRQVEQHALAQKAQHEKENHARQRLEGTGVVCWCTGVVRAFLFCPCLDRGLRVGEGNKSSSISQTPTLVLAAGKLTANFSAAC